MTPVRFFYSTNGKDVHGPVTEDALRLLIQSKVLGSHSFICREGESEWKPCKIETKPRPPAPDEPYEPPAYVPTPEALERMKMPEDEGPMPETLYRMFWLLAIGASIALTLLGASRPDSAAKISRQVGEFAGRLTFIGLLPWLIARAFKLSSRNIVRVVGAVVTALLIFAGQLYMMQPWRSDQAEDPTQQASKEARNEIATKGYYQADPKKEEQYQQSVKDAATGNTQSARITRDLLDVQDSLMVKVKASQAAEKLCDVDPITITSLDDIAHRRAATDKLHDAQTDVIEFLRDYSDRCRTAMAHDNFDAPVVIEAIERARKSAHIDLLVQLWQINQKLTDDHSARLDYLGKNWGRWSVKDGKLLFQTDDELAAYNKLVANLQEDVKNLGDVQKQIFQ